MELIEKEGAVNFSDESKELLMFRQSVLGLRVKASDEVKQNEYLLKIDNVKKFSKGDISAWVGRAKSKKTFALTMFAAALSGGLELFGKFNAIRPCKVLWIDTEQSPGDVHRVVKRIKGLVGSEESVYMYGLRPKSPIERIKAIEMLLQFHGDIEVLILDGVRDLVMDINNPVESTEVMTLLMKWSHDLDIHIATVIHLNKKDGSSRGHLGTELDNKAQSVIRVTRDETDASTSWVEEVIGRGKGVEKFSFSVDNQGMPFVVECNFKVDDDDEAPY